jgi:hypothetical protein
VKTTQGGCGLKNIPQIATLCCFQAPFPRPSWHFLLTETEMCISCQKWLPASWLCSKTVCGEGRTEDRWSCQTVCEQESESHGRRTVASTGAAGAAVSQMQSSKATGLCHLVLLFYKEKRGLSLSSCKPNSSEYGNPRQTEQVMARASQSGLCPLWGSVFASHRSLWCCEEDRAQKGCKRSCLHL